MFAVLHATAIVIANLFKSRRRLEAENALLRHQLSIALRRRAPPRLRLSGMDRAILAWMVRLWPDLIGTVQVVKPETILRWYRAGFRAFWRWKSRKRAGRPKIDRGLRDLVRRMSLENPLWGVSRIHGELLMLGFKVAQSTVSKYMVRGRRPPSQSWRTFLRNHAAAFAAIDMCVVQTVTFDRLFAFLVLGHGRRQLLWFEVTQHPTAEWLARQITEAFPWGSAPEYLVRDNDQAYGQSDGYPRPADQSRGALADGIAERLIGTLRRECLDQLIVFGESHLRRILAAYADYYNQARPHLALQKDAPLKRAVQPIGSSSSRRAASSICPDIIFGKDSSLYRSQHELLPLFKKGNAPHINNVELGKNGRWRSNVWTYPGASSLGSDAREGLRHHPTVKPVAMLEDALLDMTKRGDIVIDPFLGSGSTLIACEKTGRHCRGLELDPLYVEVILRRYEAVTRHPTVLESTGETYAELAVRRQREADHTASAL